MAQMLHAEALECNWYGQRETTALELQYSRLDAGCERPNAIFPLVKPLKLAFDERVEQLLAYTSSLELAKYYPAEEKGAMRKPAGRSEKNEPYHVSPRFGVERCSCFVASAVVRDLLSKLSYNVCLDRYDSASGYGRKQPKGEETNVVPIREEEQSLPWRFRVRHVVISSLGACGDVFHTASIHVGDVRDLSWFWMINALTRWKRSGGCLSPLASGIVVFC